MKRILIIGLILFSGLCTGQQIKNTDFDPQDWIKRGLNAMYSNLNTNELTHKCYFKNNDFYIVCEYKTTLTYSECLQLGDEMKNISKDHIYKMAEILSLNNGGLIKDFEKNYKARFINFVFTNVTSDYKTLDYKYFLLPGELYKISPYFNRNDFYEILKTL